jgi:uncharacterized membrane protein
MKRNRLFCIAGAILCLLLSLYAGTVAFQASWLSAFSGADVSRLHVQFWEFATGAVLLLLMALYLGLKAAEATEK